MAGGMSELAQEAADIEIASAYSPDLRLPADSLLPGIVCT